MDTNTAKSLVPLAVNSLRDMMRSGDSGDSPIADTVFVFLDAARPPGQDIASALLVNQKGFSQEAADAEIEGLIAESQAMKQPLTAGTFFSTENILGLLRGLATNPEEVDQIESWLSQPVPAQHIRLLVIAGDDLHGGFVEVALPN